MIQNVSLAPGEVNGDFPLAQAAALPRVLFVTTNIWSSDFLLMRALREAGVQVAMLCSRRHPVRAARLERFFELDHFRSGRSLRRAVGAFAPLLLVPGDERALRLMHDLHRTGSADERRLVEASLGRPGSYDMMVSRHLNMEAARAAGVPVPGLIGDLSRASLDRQLGQAACGIVLKADDTWGGNGVRICRSDVDITSAVAELSRRPLLHALRRWLINGDAAILARVLFSAAPSLSAQECLPVGRLGDLALFCREGVVLGLVCAERESGLGVLGPSTIVRVVERPGLADAARRFVERHGLSGFIGFDFIVDPATDEARVIEINPRATPLAAIRPQNGSSPAIGAAAGLGATSLADVAAYRPSVAYFPKAWLAHPEDPRLADCAADIPVDEPRLVEALLNQALKDPSRTSPRLREALSKPGAADREVAGATSAMRPGIDLVALLAACEAVRKTRE